MACKYCSGITRNGEKCKRLTSCIKGCKVYCFQHAEKNTKSKCFDGTGKKRPISQEVAREKKKRKITTKKPDPNRPTLKGISRKDDDLASEELDDIVLHWNKNLYKDRNVHLYSPIPAGERRTFNERLLKNKISSGTKLGFLFNTDPKKGIHWVAYWVDPVRGNAEYFDSFGHVPNSLLRSTIDHINASIRNAGGTVHEYQIHSTKHQKGATQCGVFALWFLENKIKGKSFDYIETPGRISDDKCIRKRGEYWNII